MSGGVAVRRGLAEAHRAEAALGYWRAFSAKLRVPLGPEAKAAQFLSAVLDPAHAVSAVAEDGAFLGAAGFKTDQGAFAGGGFAELRAVYGLLGAPWRMALLAALERPVEPDALLMDGIFVAPAARGRGVGGLLLDAVEAEARARGLARVRLDVIDANPRARALYDRRGFQAVGGQSAGLLAPLLGFKRATTMVKAVGPTAGPGRAG